MTLHEFSFEVGPDDEIRGSRAVEAGWPIHTAESFEASDLLHDFTGVPSEYLYERLDALNALVVGHETGAIEDEEAWKALALERYEALLAHIDTLYLDQN